jgi:hypothetical protein
MRQENDLGVKLIEAKLQGLTVADPHVPGNPIKG